MIMSAETMQWLNTNTLIGYTERRGHAWHYRKGSDNHYLGAVPLDDVVRRLFNWHPVKIPTFYDWKGKSVQSEKFAIVRDDTGKELGSFKDGYQPHDYQEWLLQNIGTLMDTSTGDLGIGSAGLLKGGAVAWVEVTVPDTFLTPEGVEFRANFLAASSFNGSLATTYKRTVQETVCDNTMFIALGEKGQQVKIKSTKNSLDRIVDAREALNLIHSAQDDFAAEVKTLVGTKLTDHQFENFIDLVAPMPDASKLKTTHAITTAEKKRDTIWRLWRNDDRVAPWRGTAFGALQAMNTYAHHEVGTRGQTKAERNMLNAVTGKIEIFDTENLEKILSLAA
jgi:phage/plasmid-like protein (TIGR03299 family)